MRGRLHARVVYSKLAGKTAYRGCTRTTAPHETHISSLVLTDAYTHAPRGNHRARLHGRSTAFIEAVPRYHTRACDMVPTRTSAPKQNGAHYRRRWIVKDRVPLTAMRSVSALAQ